MQKEELNIRKDELEDENINRLARLFECLIRVDKELKKEQK